MSKYKTILDWIAPSDGIYKVNDTQMQLQKGQSLIQGFQAELTKTKARLESAEDLLDLVKREMSLDPYYGEKIENHFKKYEEGK